MVKQILIRIWQTVLSVRRGIVAGGIVGAGAGILGAAVGFVLGFATGNPEGVIDLWTPFCTIVGAIVGYKLVLRSKPARCAKCKREFDWEQVYIQRDKLRPRTFCPHCGFLIAKWHIGGYQDRHRWKWYGENAEVNVGRALPSSPRGRWGQYIPVNAHATFREDHIDIKLVMRLLDGDTTSEAESATTGSDFQYEDAPKEVKGPEGKTETPSGLSTQRDETDLLQMQVTALKDPETFYETVETLKAMREQGVPALGYALNDDTLYPNLSSDPGKYDNKRKAIVEALEELGPLSEPAIPDLIQAFQDERMKPYAGMYRAVALAIVRIAPANKEVITALANALEDPSHGPVAAFALGEAGSNARSALPALMDALTSSAYEYQRASRGRGDIQDMMDKAGASEMMHEVRQAIEKIRRIPPREEKPQEADKTATRPAKRSQSAQPTDEESIEDEETMSTVEKKERRTRAARVINWVYTREADARKLYHELCKIETVPSPGVTAELAEYTAAPPDRLAEIRAAPPPGVVVIGEHRVGTGPWFSAAITVPLSQLPAFHDWYSDAKYRYGLDDLFGIMGLQNSQVAEYPILCDQKFSEFYLEHTEVIETLDLSEQSGVKESLPPPQRRSAKCNLCKEPIRHGDLVMRHQTDRALMACERCVKKGVASGKLSPSEVEWLEPYDDKEEF